MEGGGCNYFHVRDISHGRISIPLNVKDYIQGKLFQCVTISRYLSPDNTIHVAKDNFCSFFHQTIPCGYSQETSHYVLLTKITKLFLVTPISGFIFAVC